ncbi:MAG: hypothetical protein LBP80_06400, partial [Treponema sp.]|nr:hypothetical protein [Treponema sp.]
MQGVKNEKKAVNHAKKQLRRRKGEKLCCLGGKPGKPTLYIWGGGGGGGKNFLLKMLEKHLAGTGPATTKKNNFKKKLKYCLYL